MTAQTSRAADAEDFSTFVEFCGQYCFPAGALRSLEATDAPAEQGFSVMLWLPRAA